MRIKWNFANDISEKFNEKPVFTPKSWWKPPKGHPSLEIFLTQIKKNFLNWLSPCLITLTYSKEEWHAMRSLVNDWSVVNKKAGKGSCVVGWDREDYIAEEEETTRGWRRLQRR